MARWRSRPARVPLPWPVKRLMRAAADVMRAVAYRV